MKLSILICSLEERKAQLDALVASLTRQCTGGHPAIDDIEIFWDIDNGEKAIAHKRQDLLERATGDYICFVDDDDQVPDYYIAAILKAIESKPDVVGFSGRYFYDGREGKPFIHSIKYNHWFEDAQAYYRCPTPLNPIKREIALAVGFDPKLRLVEDHDFSRRIQPFLKTEVFIDKPMYYYYYVPKKSRAESPKKDAIPV